MVLKDVCHLAHGVGDEDIEEDIHYAEDDDEEEKSSGADVSGNERSCCS